MEPWADGSILTQHAICGIHNVTLLSMNVFVTASVLDTLGFKLIDQEGAHVRY
ncbi:hypothetical protein HAPAU_31170 [Halalkalicoccus paucihalophilus]|uniref:Uncharacterized protein n=1 Tax=Halalkalicoccus paucihalophilus TaxID=1008153 RepID=A0A151AAM8_9EURY|nr:hypothetical protein HAPAU_31170 [Halalkalicoccus paucihalophilus]